MTEKKAEKADFKKHRADTQRGLFHYRKNSHSVLIGASPKPQKAKAKANGTRFCLVSSQKQKRTIVKIFSKSDTKKRFFRGGNNRTFIVSLVDTR